MYEYGATLDRVVDGDTVDLIVDLGFSIQIKERFRLAGIDAPESRTLDLEEKKRGLAATEYLRYKLSDIAFTVETTKDRKGKYGRWIGVIYIGSENVNESMVKAGHAVFKEY